MEPGDGVAQKTELASSLLLSAMCTIHIIQFLQHEGGQIRVMQSNRNLSFGQLGTSPSPSSKSLCLSLPLCEVGLVRIALFVKCL